MSFSKLLVSSVACALALSSCGGGGIDASNCTEITNETMLHIQRLIDDVDEGFGGEHTIQEFLAAGGELPSVQRFESEAATIDELAAELGCTESEIGDAIGVRVSELAASTDLGRFIIDAIRSGGL